MPKIEVKHPDQSVSTGAYSAAVACDGWLYVSGQCPVDLATGKLVHGTIEEETRLVLSHLDTVLNAAGCTSDDVVKCTCHLADIAHFDRFNAVYGEYFTGIRPARITVQAVLWGGMKVEIDAVARIPPGSPVAEDARYLGGD